MKSFKTTLVLFILAFTFSCSNEQTENSEFVFEKSIILKDYQISKKDIESLQKLGFSGSSGVAMRRTTTTLI